MKRLILTGLVLSGLMVPAQATEVWQGTMFVTAANSPCRADGVVVGDFYLAVYRPRNVEDNGVDTRLALFTTRSANRYIVINKPFDGNGRYEGIRVSTTALVQDWSGNFSGATVNPPSPTPSTQTVEITVTFTKFNNNSGCTATLVGSLTNRPAL